MGKRGTKATHRRQWAMCVGIGALIIAATGCQQAHVTISPEQRLELEQRSVGLLMRAAQSDDPYVSANAMESLSQVAPDEGRPYFRAALSSDYPLARSAALKALGRLRDTSALPLIRQQLANSSKLVQLAAAYAAYRCGETARAAMLVDALDSHPEENVRAEAARLLGLLDEPRAKKRLKAALRQRSNERSSKVRLEIWTALARLGDDDAIHELIYAAQGTPEARVVALQSLAELAPEAARDALIYRFGPDEDYLVNRLIAARGLARLHDPRGYEFALEETRYEGLDPEDPEDAARVRVNAVLTLGEIGNLDALDRLRTIAANEDDPRLQIAACFAICRILEQTEPSEAIAR